MVLSWIILGLMAGGLASLVLSGGDDDVAGDILLGMIGALLSGLLASALLGVQHPWGAVIAGSVLAAIVGAILVVAIAEALSGRRV